MKNTAASDESGIQLAPPGAGLPMAELHIARWLFRITLWTGDPEKFRQTFEQERRKISELYRACMPEAAARRVLIKRVRGIEDSSRHWSVWMTLDHLRIVNHSIAGTIKDLSQGKILGGVASTAAVKPSPKAGVAVLPDYETSCDAVLCAAKESPNLKTSVRFAHPWFGPLDALSWYALAGTHMAIHRRQIGQIQKEISLDA